MLKIVSLSGLLLIALCSSAIAQVVPRCRYSLGIEDAITDSTCKVTREGSLDKQYKGKRTFVPGKMTILWSDGVITKIEFKSIFEINGGAVEGAATVDGHIYRFVRSGDGKGLVFTTLDPNLNTKEISILFDYKR